MSVTRKKRLLLSAHGIRTLGSWQDLLEQELGDRYSHKPFRFGYVSLPRFVRSRQRAKVVEEFHEWYIERCREFEPVESRRERNRPSMIAHSFGTYVVGEAMQKYRQMRFDKIILCGSILPPDFAWGELLARNQVWSVRNEYGLQDTWARIVGHFVPRMGDSGWSGFEHESPCIQQERFEYHRHSDYFRRDHIHGIWGPFLDRNPLAVSVWHGHQFEDARRFHTILNRTASIDTACYGHLPDYREVEIPRGLSETWIRIEPDIYTFLLDENGQRPLGYVNAMPLKRDTFESVLQGTKDDNEIVAGDLVSYTEGGDVLLYLMSVAIEPSARVAADGVYQRSFERLLWAVEGKLQDYWHRYGSRAAEIAAVGWTPEGRKLCELLGLQRRGLDRHGNPVYWRNVIEQPDGPGRLGNLVGRLRRLYLGGG